MKLNADSIPDLDSEQELWAYNALDCIKTVEVFKNTRGQLDEVTQKVYDFERALQAPALEMMLRGIKVNPLAIHDALSVLRTNGATLDSLLAEYGSAILERNLNPNSRKDLGEIFYQILGLPEQKKYDRKEKKEKVALDREALEKLSELSPLAQALCSAILARRDIGKKESVLRAGIDPDGRMRFSFNIAGTETGRWSSSQNITRGGMNAQNITEEIRHIFIADEGFKLCYLDLEQAESKAVARLSGDSAYTSACYSGDLHTTVARLVWPKLQWTGDTVADRAIADQIFYRHFSYRDMSKRGGHGTNYLGAPRTMAKHLKVETKLIQSFQENYFTAFPGIAGWHKSVAHTLQTTGTLVTPFGRRRRFLGRLWDNATLRQAVAFVPQSMIADYLNRGLYYVWKELPVQLLFQIHDAILFQYPEGREDLCFAAAEIVSREWDGFVNPCDLAVGWNFGKASEKNPHGLTKLKKNKPDTRTSPKYASFEILDRRLS